MVATATISARNQSFLLRGGSKDVLNEVERNIQDAMQVAKNIVLEPKLLPGGGASEAAATWPPPRARETGKQNTAATSLRGGQK